ncbi:MAG: hypothetical protein JNL39_03450 [Opitutaceae bacterium]|nr:hypothetical protein [Opitutaceae bacterium]
MVAPRRIGFALALFILPVFGSAAEAWAKLKPGMTATETTGALGQYLFSTRGRGFEIGIYEGKAEVVFLRGQLVAWTSPASQPNVQSPPMAAFQFNQQWRPLPDARVFEAPAAAQRAESSPGRRGYFLPLRRL